MATRGRKPKPTSLKILEATRADRINDREPAVPSGRPEVPDHLDGLARGEWERLVALLERMGILTAADGPALMLYCECYSKWLRARTEIVKRGMFLEEQKTTVSKRGSVTTSTGRVTANPGLAIELAMGRVMQSILVEFGLTPSSRCRIRIEAANKQDPLAEFLGRKHG